MEKSAANNMGRVLIVILLAQFIIVIDSTFMNVSISTLVKDFHTTVTSIQNAITLYTLVMAAFMIAGAKFGDIIGRKRAFTLGLTVYAVGTTITSLSPTLPVFIFGWSLLEGLGAALMLPAMMSLIVANFPAGPPRAKAYASFAAIAGIAAGVGPIIGGLFTTYLSWRLAFFSELIVAGYIFWQRRIIADAPYEGPKPTFDWTGFSFCAIGLATLVEGIILASSYGLFVTRTAFIVAGTTLLPAGAISPTVILVLLGLIILAAFAAIEVRKSHLHHDTLVDISLFKIRTVRAGSTAQLVQNLLTNGVIFAISLYLQMALAYNAIRSGIALLPLSIAVLLSAGLSTRYISKLLAPKIAVLGGFVTVGLGAIALGLTARHATSGSSFIIGLALIGLGLGAIASQNQNLIMSSVSQEQSNETSGIINTALNIGSSLGTSLAGAFILSVFVATATGLVNQNTTFTASQKTQLNSAVTANAQIVSNAQLQAATAKLQPAQQQAILNINSEARSKSLSTVYFGLGLFSLVGILAALRLPLTKPLAASSSQPSPAPAAAKRA
jgi:MFS family permease